MSTYYIAPRLIRLNGRYEQEFIAIDPHLGVNRYSPSGFAAWMTYREPVLGEPEPLQKVYGWGDPREGKWLASCPDCTAFPVTPKGEAEDICLTCLNKGNIPRKLNFFHYNLEAATPAPSSTMSSAGRWKRWDDPAAWA